MKSFVRDRGGSGIKYYELGDGDAGTGTSLPSAHFCHEYKAVGDPLSGLAVLPPQSLDIARVEVARLLRLTATSVEPVSLMLPRSGDLKDYFQDDIYRWVRCGAVVNREKIVFSCVYAECDGMNGWMVTGFCTQALLGFCAWHCGALHSTGVGDFKPAAAFGLLS